MLQGWIFFRFRLPSSAEFRLFWPFRFRLPSSAFSPSSAKNTPLIPVKFLASCWFCWPWFFREIFWRCVYFNLYFKDNVFYSESKEQYSFQGFPSIFSPSTLLISNFFSAPQVKSWEFWRSLCQISSIFCAAGENF